MDSPAAPRDSWNCEVCGSLSHDIHILPCNHRFCARCLQVWVGVYVDMYRSGQQEFPCRLCWRFFNMPQTDGGLASFKYSADVHDLGLQFTALQVQQQQQQHGVMPDHNVGHAQNRDYSSEISYSREMPFSVRQFQNTEMRNTQDEQAYMNSDSNATPFHSNALISSTQQSNGTEGNYGDRTEQINTAPDMDVLNANCQPTMAASSDTLSHTCNPDFVDPNSCNRMDEADATDSEELGSNPAQSNGISRAHNTANLQNVYEEDWKPVPNPLHAQRLCFPSCHTYMYHLW